MEKSSSAKQTSENDREAEDPLEYHTSRHLNGKRGRKTNFQLVAETKSIKTPSSTPLSHKSVQCGYKIGRNLKCEKVFTSMRIRNTHVKHVHQKIRPFKCGDCELEWRKKYRVADLGPFIDERGRITYYADSDFTGHKKEKKKTIMFLKENDLKKHMTSQHLEIVIVCKYCLHKFSNRSNLSRHLRYGRNKCMAIPDGTTDDELRQVCKETEVVRKASVDEPEKVYSVQDLVFSSDTLQNVFAGKTSRKL